MNRRMNKVVVASLLALVMLVAGCRRVPKDGETVANGSFNTESVTSTTVRAQPQEATYDQILNDLSVDLSVPANATDIHYGTATLADGRVVGQVDYKIDGFQVHLRGYNYGDIDIDSLSPLDLDDLVNLSELTHTFNASGGGFSGTHISGNGEVTGSYNTSEDGYGRLDFLYRSQNTVYSLWVDFGSTEIDMPELYQGNIVFVTSET